MRLNNIAFAFFLLWSCATLFAADQGDGLLDSLDKYVQVKKDEALLHGLVEASGLIKHVQLERFYSGHQDYQYASQARCQYGASCAFEQTLSRTIGLISDKDLAVELQELNSELKKMHQEHNAYGEHWPESAEVCKKSCEKYAALLSATSEKIGRVARSYHRRLPSEKLRLLGLIESLMKINQFDEELTHRVRGRVEQQSMLEEVVGALSLEENQLKGLVEKGEREVADLKAAQAALEAQLKARQEEGDQQMAAQALALTQKAEEVSQFQVDFGELLQSSFERLAFGGVSIEGIESDPVFEKMKISLNEQIARIQGQFEKSQTASWMEKEKVARHRFIINITEVDTPKNPSLFKKNGKRQVHGFVTAEVAYLNIKKSIYSGVEILKFYDDGGFVRSKNQDFFNVINEMVFRRIPRLKKTVYNLATSVENQQQLYDLCIPILERHPVCLSRFQDNNPMEPPPHSQILPEPLLSRNPCAARADLSGPGAANNRFCLLCGHEDQSPGPANRR